MELTLRALACIPWILLIGFVLLSTYPIAAQDILAKILVWPLAFLGASVTQFELERWLSRHEKK
jgi:hypothetical protein